ncbi:hypothetical protein GPK34_05980 [Secundilactobacillus kimchicus]|uniref:hypothetical protein n=1 Tax=Secundilactobacillus kimchicus TaxID=528209 RepID=UPI001C036DEB|nr:hypothetical protein [Secundilactobacillus kimchicus]MBT9671574.1 hypothetical protein [Secundilactobacillus kimchicus]
MKKIVQGLMAFGCTLFVSATVGSAKTDFVTTTAPIEVGTVVIPKNTRLSFIDTSQVANRTVANIDWSALSYTLRQQKAGDSLQLPYSDHLRASKDTAADRLPWFYQGRYVGSEARQLARKMLKVTSDQYLEYYKSHDAQQKPISMTKITKSIKKGKFTFLYAKTNMAKLPDKKVRSTGNYRYRLTIRDNGTKTDPASQQKYSSFSVGRVANKFFVPEGRA